MIALCEAERLNHGEESPGSRKQGVRRKAETGLRETLSPASESHRNYVEPITLKVKGNE